MRFRAGQNPKAQQRPTKAWRRPVPPFTPAIKDDRNQENAANRSVARSGSLLFSRPETLPHWKMLSNEAKAFTLGHGVLGSLVRPYQRRGRFRDLAENFTRPHSRQIYPGITENRFPIDLPQLRQKSVQDCLDSSVAGRPLLINRRREGGPRSRNPFERPEPLHSPGFTTLLISALPISQYPFPAPADSGRRRTGFRGEAEQSSGLIPNTIPG